MVQPSTSRVVCGGVVLAVGCIFAPALSRAAGSLALVSWDTEQICSASTPDDGIFAQIALAFFSSIGMQWCCPRTCIPQDAALDLMLLMIVIFGIGCREVQVNCFVLSSDVPRILQYLIMVASCPLNWNIRCPSHSLNSFSCARPQPSMKARLSSFVFYQYISTMNQ